MLCDGNCNLIISGAKKFFTFIKIILKDSCDLWNSPILTILLWFFYLEIQMLKTILRTPRNSHEGEQTPQLPWVSSAILHQPYLRINLGLMHSWNGGTPLALGLDAYTRIRWDSSNFWANPSNPSTSTSSIASFAPSQSRLQFLCFSVPSSGWVSFLHPWLKICCWKKNGKKI